jgi:virulence factor
LTDRTPRTRVGVIGLGSIAKRVYLPELLQRTDVDVVGVASRKLSTAQDIGAQHRVEKCLDSVDALLGLGLDIAFVHASTPAHNEIVRTCLDAGVHVYVDKPLTDSASTSTELAHLAQTKGLLLAVGFNRRFAPLHVQARELVPMPDSVSMYKHRTSLDDRSVRSTVFEDVIHLVDTLQWALNDEAVLVDYQRSLDEQGRLISAVGTLKGASAVGTFAMNWHAGSDVERLTMVGGGTSAEVVNLERLTVAHHDKVDRVSKTCLFDLSDFSSWSTIHHRRGFTDLISHVFSSLDKPARCQVEASRVLATHVLAEEIVRRSS